MSPPTRTPAARLRGFRGVRPRHDIMSNTKLRLKWGNALWGPHRAGPGVLAAPSAVARPLSVAPFPDTLRQDPRTPAGSPREVDRAPHRAHRICRRESGRWWQGGRSSPSVSISIGTGPLRSPRLDHCQYSSSRTVNFDSCTERGLHDHSLLTPESAGACASTSCRRGESAILPPPAGR